MPGGLLNLISYGNQNIILTGNPSKTFFKCTYAKYTNFGLQKFRLDFKGQRILQPSAPSVFKFKVPRHADLLLDTYLVVTLPTIWSPILPPATCDTPWRPYEFKWIENIGSQIIKSVQFTIGGHLVQSFTGQYLYNMVERDFSEEKKKLYYEMTGNTKELNDPANAFNRNGKYPNAYVLDSTMNPEGVEPSIRSRKLYIPLNIWFTLAAKMSLPLASLQYAELEIEIELRPIYELFVIRDPTPSAQHTHGVQQHKEVYIKYSSTLTSDKANYIQPSFNLQQQQMFRFLQEPPSLTLDPEDYPNQNASNWDADIHLISTYAFLSEDEVRAFTLKPQSYLIREVRQHNHNNISGTTRVALDTTGMVANWMWFFQRTDVASRNGWSNYTNWEYSDPTQPLFCFHTDSGGNWPHLTWDAGLGHWVASDSGKTVLTDCSYGTTPTFTLPTDGTIINPSYQPYSYSHDEGVSFTGPYTSNNIRDIMLKWGVLLDGKYRENTLDAGILNYVEKYVRTSGNAPRDVYCYNFGLHTNPFDVQPSGAINLSKFSRVEFEVETIIPPVDSEAQVLTVCDSCGNAIGVNKPVWNIYKYSYDLTVLEERYNILKIESGTAGLVYTR